MANHGHDGDEEYAPSHTIYQWSPEEAVEHGHEGRDVDLVAVARWFIAVALLVAITIGVMVWVFTTWSGYEDRTDLLASPVLGMRQPPPLPQVLPNPADSDQYADKRLRNPSDFYLDFRLNEDKALQQYGLADQNGTPTLPPNAVAAVGAAPAAGSSAPASALLAEPLPSNASGGTAFEDAKR